jgi:hypothetical protein
MPYIFTTIPTAFFVCWWPNVFAQPQPETSARQMDLSQRSEPRSRDLSPCSSHIHIHIHRTAVLLTISRRFCSGSKEAPPHVDRSRAQFLTAQRTSPPTDLKTTQVSETSWN